MRDRVRLSYANLDVGTVCAMTGSNGVRRWMVVESHDALARETILRPASWRDRARVWLGARWWRLRYRIGWV